MNNPQTNLEFTKELEVKGAYTKVRLTRELFTLINQSVFARKNKVTPTLMFTTRQNAKLAYFDVFTLNGVEVSRHAKKVLDPTTNEEKTVSSFFVLTSAIKPEMLVVEPTTDLDADLFTDEVVA
jgi:hypothetical protein